MTNCDRRPVARRSSSTAHAITGSIRCVTSVKRVVWSVVLFVAVSGCGGQGATSHREAGGMPVGDEPEPASASEGWAITVGGSMSGVGAVGNPGEAPLITAVLPDGRELTADEDGAFGEDLPNGTRISINGEFAAEVDEAEGDAASD